MAVFEAQSSSNRYIYLRLEVNETGTSIEGNSSTVSWELRVAKSASATDATWGNCSYSVSINGEGHSGSSNVSVSPNGVTAVLSGTTTVAHDSDGSKTISVSGSISGKIAASVSGTLTLSNIGRASSLRTAGSTIGSPITLTIDASSSSFRHAVTFTYGTYYTTILSNVLPGTYTWTPELELCNQIPSATSLTGTLYIATWNAGSFVDDKSFPYTLYVPASVKPSLSGMSLAPESDNSVVSGWGLYVKGFSKIGITATAAGSYGSSVESVTYAVTGLSSASGGTGYTTAILTRSGTVTVSAYATDSRGRRSDTVSRSITVYDYADPTLSGVSLYRCTADGSASGTGLYLYAKATANVSSVNGKNSGTLTVQYRQAGAGSWQSSAGLTSGTGKILGGSLSYTRSWEANITLTDKLGRSASATVTIPTDSVTLNLLEGGNGAAFGKYAETANLLDIAWNVAIGGSTMSDFAVASGTSGGWDYIKFANGIAACWRRVVFSGASIGAQVGNIYMSEMIMGAMAYPFTFAEVPNELVTANCDGKFVWPALASVNTKTNASTLRLAAPTAYNTSSTAVSGAFSVFTIGRWK